MLIPHPFFLYGAAAAVLVAGASGWKVRDWQCKAAEVAEMKKLVEEKDRMQEVIDAQSAEYEALRASATAVSEVRTNTIREIFRTSPPVVLGCAPPSAVERVLVEAVQDANRAASGTSGQSGGSVPATGSTADTADRP